MTVPCSSRFRVNWLCANFHQSYIEDCQVGCRPNRLDLEIDENSFDVTINTDYET